MTAQTARRAPVPAPDTLSALVCAVCAAFLIAAVLFLPLFPCFCVQAADGSGTLLLPESPSPAAFLSRAFSSRIPDTEFVISYTHSVNKGRVRDYCSFGPDRSIRVAKTRFVSYGAGMPEPEPGTDFVVTDDYLELRNLNLTMPRLILAVGVVANHEIECGPRRFALADHFAPQTSLAIEYRNISVFDYIRSN